MNRRETIQLPEKCLTKENPAIIQTFVRVLGLNVSQETCRNSLKTCVRVAFFPARLTVIEQRATIILGYITWVTNSKGHGAAGFSANDEWKGAMSLPLAVS